MLEKVAPLSLVPKTTNIQSSPLEEIQKRYAKQLELYNEMKSYLELASNLQTIFDNITEGFSLKVMHYIEADFDRIFNFFPIIDDFKKQYDNNVTTLISFDKKNEEMSPIMNNLIPLEQEEIPHTIKTLNSSETKHSLGLAYYYSYFHTYLFNFENKILKTSIDDEVRKSCITLLESIIKIFFAKDKGTGKSISVLPIQYGCFLLESALELLPEGRKKLISQYKEEYLREHKKLFDKYGSYECFDSINRVYLYEAVISKMMGNKSSKHDLQLVINSFEEHKCQLQLLIGHNNNLSIPSAFLLLRNEILKIMQIIHKYNSVLHGNASTFINRDDLRNMDVLISDALSKLYAVYIPCQLDQSRDCNHNTTLEKYLLILLYSISVQLSDFCYERMSLDKKFLIQKPFSLQNNTSGGKECVSTKCSLQDYQDSVEVIKFYYSNMAQHVKYVIDLRKNTIPQILKYFKQYNDCFINIEEINGPINNKETKYEIVKVNIEPFIGQCLQTIELFNKFLKDIKHAEKLAKEDILKKWNNFEPNVQNSENEIKHATKETAQEVAKKRADEEALKLINEVKEEKKKLLQQQNRKNRNNNYNNSTKSKKKPLPAVHKKKNPHKPIHYNINVTNTENSQLSLCTPLQYDSYKSAAKAYIEDKNEGINQVINLLNSEKESHFIASLCFTILSEHEYLSATHIYSVCSVKSWDKNFFEKYDYLAKAHTHFTNALNYTNKAIDNFKECKPCTKTDYFSMDQLKTSIGWNLKGDSASKKPGIKNGIDEILLNINNLYNVMEEARREKMQKPEWYTNCFNPDWHPSEASQKYYCTKIMQASYTNLDEECTKIGKNPYIYNNEKNTNNCGFTTTFNK